MHSFFEKQLKRVLPCLLIMIISCCIFLINAGAETIVILEDKKLFGAPEVSTASLTRSVNVDALGDYLREELIKCSSAVDISSFKLEYNETNAKILSNIIYYESPELFHINGLSMSVLNGTIRTVIPKYEYSAQEYTKMYNACINQANIILDGIAGNSQLNDIQKALLIHDRLAVHCEYDTENYNNNSIPEESYTMYGTLAKGVSVCQGYAESYMYLLEKVGIESRLCSSDKLNHTWNIITVNGKEYHVDVTWDDPTIDKVGQVLHTNFLRSSNGIYSTEHYASDYDTTPTDTTYDSYFWQDSETAFQSVGNEIYYIDNAAGALKYYSNKSTMIELPVNTWPASTDGYVWIGNFSRLASDGTNLYYNLPDAVYKFTVSTGVSEKIWSPDLSAGALFRIYGFTYKDGYLICDINDTPDFELHDKKNNQQKYLYQDHSASTLQSISISSFPKKTEYYIGDSLDTEGLQLKLTYSNGSSKYVTSGFTVSGFRSTSSGSKKVTVTYEGFTTSFNVNVRTPGIMLDASSIKIDLKDFCVLKATTDPKNVSVRWLTSDKNIATVSDGEIEAVAVGTAVITAEFTYNGYTYKTTCNVTVECVHSFVKPIKGTPATCTENGLTDGKKCTVCNTVITEQKTISALGHKWKDATCTTAKTCIVCNATEGKATGHKETTREENRKEASCKNNGSYYLVTYCSVCSTVIKTERKTIAATGNHIYVTETQRVASTCKTEGYVVTVCGCGKTKTETLGLDANNHENIIVMKAVEPACTESGLTEGKKCSDCGTVTVAQQTIAEKGHREVTVKGKDSTCSETGLTDGRKCFVCGTVTAEQKEIAKKRHWTVRIPGKAPTETETGLTDGEKCLVCGTVTVEQQIIPELNHNHDYTSTVTEPTCTEMGYTTYVCSCGAAYKNSFVSALGHNTQIIAGKEATCTEPGFTNGEKCSVCDEIIVNQEEIEKLGHTHGEWETVKEPQIDEDGLMQQKCTVCGEVIDEKVIPALDDKPKNAFGDANGDGKVTAADARLILRMAAKIDPYSDEQIAYLDINKDERITAADARIILRISAKIESIESYIK